MGFEPSVKPELLNKRVYDFLLSNGPASLRDVYEALSEESNGVDECLRRLWKRGFILTYVDQGLPRDKAIREAFERTSKVLIENPTTNTIHDRVRHIRDQLLTTNELLSLSYFKHVLDCPIDQMKRAIKRAKQLYSDIKEIRIFDKFTYYYLDNMKPEDLAANIELKKNYIRVRFGRENRIGHNWEACVDG